MRWDELADERCPVARALSVLGDRWTLLVLRDCFLKVRRFEDFQARLGVSRHVLADRLRKLVAAGVLQTQPYSRHPPRNEYRLTAKGRDLSPVLMALVRWSDRHMAHTAGSSVQHVHLTCGQVTEAIPVCSACGEPLAPETVAVRRLDSAAAAGG